MQVDATPTPITLDCSGMEVLTLRGLPGPVVDRKVGRLGFVEAGGPVILPVNFAMDGSQGRVPDRPWVEALCGGDERPGLPRDRPLGRRGANRVEHPGQGIRRACHRPGDRAIRRARYHPGGRRDHTAVLGSHHHRRDHRPPDPDRVTHLTRLNRDPTRSPPQPPDATGADRRGRSHRSDRSGRLTCTHREIGRRVRCRRGARSRVRVRHGTRRCSPCGRGDGCPLRAPRARRTGPDNWRSRPWAAGDT